ncbi:MAG: hypothetical protein D6773_18880 [Alphaproteobacteria bacterium]|nr:MAG: hypothetical protein D6773_18880 [Alphaproteobacteria bacterium]
MPALLMVVPEAIAASAKKQPHILRNRCCAELAPTGLSRAVRTTGSLGAGPCCRDGSRPDPLRAQQAKALFLNLPPVTREVQRHGP